MLSQTDPPSYTLTQQAMPPPVSPELYLALAADPTTHNVHISIIPPREPLSHLSNDFCRRAPVDICCVIDISGSMDSELKASLDEGKAAESTGLSTLDVVKHAVNTIIATTQPEDRIAIVTFSSHAMVIAGLTPMTAVGKSEVLQGVQNLHTLNSTNIWAGLKTGMDVLNGLAPVSRVTHLPVFPARLSTLFLLTDGMPNINPPRGIIPMLQSYLDSHPINFSIHTFGFGYTLDSQLLLQIARLGGGAYGFIPDASSLGAVLIHSVANLYSTCAERVELNIEYLTDGKPDTVQGLDLPDGQSTTQIEVGAVQYGQKRNFLVKMKGCSQLATSINDAVMSVTVRYRPWTHGPEEELLTSTTLLTREAVASGASEQDLVELDHHLHRSRFIRAVDDVFNSASASPLSVHGSRLPHTTNAEAPLPLRLSVAIHEFKAILHSLQSPPLSTHALGSALAQDITGEVLLALSSSDIFSRWGRHYLPSLARYHLLQQCGSFRDPGLQVYGAESPLFNKFRDELDQVFDSLPPPEPTIRPTRTVHTHTPGHAGTTLAPGTTPGTSTPSPARRHRVSMSTAFASRSGPCFAGACKITLAGGTQLALKELQRGMRVDTPQGDREVVAVLKTRMAGREALLCELPGGLNITPWHPIKVFSSDEQDARWVFPLSQARPTLQACDAIYSVLLEPDARPDAHGVYIQGVLCVTLGHGITHARHGCSYGDVRAHEFLGDYGRIVQSLAAFPATAEAGGVFHVAYAVKHGVSGMICGFASYPNEVSESLIGTLAPRIPVT